MIKNIVFSMVFLMSFVPTLSQEPKKHGFSLSNGIATTIKNEIILVGLAGYTLLVRPEWVQQYPYITAFCGACLIGSVIKNTFASSLEFSSNSFIRTAVKCPFSTGLAAYALAFNRELIRQHPLAATLVGLWLALQWSENV